VKPAVTPAAPPAARASAPTSASRLIDRLPSTVDARVRLLAWASLVIQTVLIGTGGAVRLTGSGLGCPTWPQCTAGSLTNTPEMGIHGLIEFANRALTGVVVVIAILVFVSVLRMRAERRDLFVITLLQGLSIPLQAVIGGITVLTGLNPYIVGVHFVVSILLVLLTSMLVYRVYYGPRGTARLMPGGYLVLAHVTTLFVAITVIVGVLTTGSGPHAGDAHTPRNGLDTAFLQHAHSWPAYATLAGTLLLVFGAFRSRIAPPRLRRFVVILLGVELVQIAVGLTQARMGLPEVLVGLHMVLAGALVGVMTAVVLSSRSSGLGVLLGQTGSSGSMPTARKTSVR
jgi:cytochrome c oxidase assembly protein subunit 15